jgi:hypothetical protein
VIHFIAWSSHRDVQAACGLSAFGWEQDDDPEGTVGGDDEGRRVYFAKEGQEERVDCLGCRPKADEAIERRKKYEADVAAAGGIKAYREQQNAKLRALFARAKRNP